MSELDRVAWPTPAHAKKQGRSPAYPGIDLKTAIDRAKVVYQQEKRNKAPVRVIMLHWGYNNPSGGNAGVTLGSLKKFGLLKDEGSGLDRLAWLTDLAFDIIHNPDPSAAIRAAALAPPVHAQLWHEYASELPSDDALKWKLLQRGFTESGAVDFIREYRSTIAFAKLGLEENPGVWTEEQASPSPRDSTLTDKTESRDSLELRKRSSGAEGQSDTGTLKIPVPLVGGATITVEGSFPITESAWMQFTAVLAAMKPGLVANQESDQLEEE